MAALDSASRRSSGRCSSPGRVTGSVQSLSKTKTKQIRKLVLFSSLQQGEHFCLETFIERQLIGGVILVGIIVVIKGSQSV